MPNVRAIFLFIFSVILCLMFAACDSNGLTATPELTSTVTPEVSSTLTPEISPTITPAAATDTPAVTGTPEKTPEKTPEITATPAPTPTPTIKPTATRTPSPSPAPTATPDPKGFNINLSTAAYGNGTLLPDGRYTIGENFTVTFSESINYTFNRYSITYTSDVYIRGYVTYMLNGSSYQEEFFLEPGTDITFSSLTDKFFNKYTGNNTSKITLSAINAATGKFKLKAVNLEKTDVPNTTVFLQNSYHKIGIDLRWGGALNYIENLDKKTISLGNLLNRADTGRLVQQSYYGTLEKPYVTGEFGGNVWPYNPVQGGDKYNNSSKIVDFVIEADRVYIKCRPLDWAHNNSPTLSYMENEYSLDENMIIVRNRFVDFSGYKAKARHQELPAFYVISYLGDFVFYNGKKPWTDDTLTVKTDLPFWGGNSDCYFNVQSGNTETWCAWVDKDNFGIGLYVPKTEILLAGRFSYNGSKDPANGATNYVAPLRTFELKSFNPFEYSYVISSGKLDTMRATFKDYYNRAS